MGTRVLIFKLYIKIAQIISQYPVGKHSTIVLIHNFIITHLKPKIIEFEGFKIYLDSSNSLRLSKTPNDMSLQTALIKKTVVQGQNVLDVGAHIGYYSLIMSKLVGDSGKVYAFEPESKNFELLKQNIKVNLIKNITPIKKAVVDVNGKLKVYRSETSQADHRVYLQKDSKRKTEAVEAIFLDGYFGVKEKIDFVKIDVQGVEPQVIIGMSEIIKLNKDIKIFIEFWPEGLKLAGFEADKLLSLLEGFGFHFYDIDEWQYRPIRISKEQLLKKYTVSNKRDTNLLCLR